LRAPLDIKSTFQEASKVGEATASQIGFANVATQRLRDAIEKQGIVVLHVDAIPEVSGAACQLTSLHAVDVILINRNEPLFRRRFDLAHEFFHLLTWDAMPPMHLESVKPRGKEAKIERLAENFAAGLLMPMELLQPHLESKAVTEINSWLNQTATALCVSSSALRYRLTNCGLLSAADRAKIDESKLRNNGLSGSGSDQTPALFSRRFMEVVGKGIAAGQVSIRKTCNLLQLDMDQLRRAFVDHGLEPPMS
jgi:Zn-dependent peptidase ImmA (M78 family)